MEQRGRFKDSFGCANELPRKGLTEWRGGCMPWCSIWKDGQRLKLPASSKYIDPKSPSGCTTGNDGAWTGFWRDTALAAPKNSPIRNCGLWRTFWTVVRWPMDSIPASGPARWSPGLLRKNFRFPTIQPMFLVSFNSWDSRSSAPRRSWPVPTSRPNRDGCGIAIRTLKKIQKRRSRPPLRGRSLFPAGSHSLPNLGEGRMPARNSHHRAEEGFESLWHDRTLCGPFPVPFSRSLQCFDLYRLPGEADSKLLSTENLSDPGQRFLPQGWGGMGLVFRPSPKHRGSQSAVLLPRTQCFGKSLALYARGCYSQSIFRNPRRAIWVSNFNIPKYPASTVTGTRSFISFPIIVNKLMSLYLCNDI
jgi:hypothetical protein